MNPERQMQQALQALAEHDRAREAHASAAAIFARRPRAARWPVGVAIAAGLAGVALLLQDKPPVTHAPGPVAAPPLEAVATVTASQPKPARRVKAATAPREIVTEFFPLMDAPPPFQRGQLLRVVVPVSTMRSVGLPVRRELWGQDVQADVLVGEEGMARAIRFVGYEQ